MKLKLVVSTFGKLEVRVAKLCGDGPEIVGHSLLSPGKVIPSSPGPKDEIDMQ